jgi:hypothetical protein
MLLKLKSCPRNQRILQEVLTLLNKGRRIQATFREIYRTNGFSERESISGPGSSLEQTFVIWRPLNLQQPPICFPPPLQLIREECTEGGGQWPDKSLGLWRNNDIPVFSTHVRQVSQRNREG